jgi:hypothetical protein
MKRVRRALRAIWPRRLAAQLIALLLFALVASQIVSLVILLDERGHALRAADRAQVLARTASIVRLMEATPPELHPQILPTTRSILRLRPIVTILYSSAWTICSKAAPSRCWSS